MDLAAALPMTLLHQALDTSTYTHTHIYCICTTKGTLRGECINSCCIIYHCEKAVASSLSQVFTVCRSVFRSVTVPLTAAVIYYLYQCESVIRKSLEPLQKTENGTNLYYRQALASHFLMLYSHVSHV